MNEERKRILKMLEEHKITAEEAEKLLGALGETDRVSGRNIIVKVYDKIKGKAEVNITLPLAVARWGLQFAPAAKLAEHGLDRAAIADAIESGLRGKVVDIDQDDKHVEVYIT